MYKFKKKLLLASAAILATLGSVVGMTAAAKPVTQSTTNNSIASNARTSLGKTQQNAVNALATPSKPGYFYGTQKSGYLAPGDNIMWNTNNTATTDADEPLNIVKEANGKYYLQCVQYDSSSRLLIRNDNTNNFASIFGNQNLIIDKFVAIKPGKFNNITQTSEFELLGDYTGELLLSYHLHNDPFQHGSHMLLFSNNRWTNYTDPVFDISSTKSYEVTNIYVTHDSEQVVFGVYDGNTYSSLTFAYDGSNLTYLYSITNLPQINFFFVTLSTFVIGTKEGLISYTISDDNFRFKPTGKSVNNNIVDATKVYPTNGSIWSDIVMVTIKAGSYNSEPKMKIPLIDIKVFDGMTIGYDAIDLGSFKDPISGLTATFIGFDETNSGWVFYTNSEIIFSLQYDGTSSPINMNKLLTYGQYDGPSGVTWSMFTFYSSTISLTSSLLSYYYKNMVIGSRIVYIGSNLTGESEKIYNNNNANYSASSPFRNAITFANQTKFVIPYQSSNLENNSSVLFKLEFKNNNYEYKRTPLSNNGVFSSNNTSKALSCTTLNYCQILEPGVYQFVIYNSQHKSIFALNLWYKNTVDNLFTKAGNYTNTKIMNGKVLTSNGTNTIIQAVNLPNFSSKNWAQLNVNYDDNKIIDFTNSWYIKGHFDVSETENIFIQDSAKRIGFQTSVRDQKFMPGVYRLTLFDIFGNYGNIYLEVGAENFQATVQHNDLPKSTAHINVNVPKFKSLTSQNNFNSAVRNYNLAINSTLLNTESSVTTEWNSINLGNKFAFDITKNPNEISNFLPETSWDETTQQLSLSKNWQIQLKGNLTREFEKEASDSAYNIVKLETIEKLHNISIKSLLSKNHVSKPTTAKQYLNFAGTHQTFADWLISKSSSIYHYNLMLMIILPVIFGSLLLAALYWLIRKVYKNIVNPFGISSVKIKNLRSKENINHWIYWDRILRRFYWIHLDKYTIWTRAFFYKQKRSLTFNETFITMQTLLKNHWHNGMNVFNFDGTFWSHNKKCSGKEWAHILINANDYEQYISTLKSKYKKSRPIKLLKNGLADFIASQFQKEIEPLWNIFTENKIALPLSVKLRMHRILLHFNSNDYNSTMNQLRNLIEETLSLKFGDSVTSNFKKNWNKVIVPQLSKSWSKDNINETLAKLSNINHWRNILGKVKPPVTNTSQTNDYNWFYGLTNQGQRDFVYSKIKDTFDVIADILSV